VLAGIALMIAGGRLAVAGAERLTTPLHLADSAVGLTFVALATVAGAVRPDLGRRPAPPRRARPGRVLGSALYNFHRHLGRRRHHHPVALIALSPRRRLGRLAGVVLLAAYAAYVFLTLHWP
jgi:Ca2+/Na+ antiporter